MVVCADNECQLNSNIMIINHCNKNKMRHFLIKKKNVLKLFCGVEYEKKKQ